MNGKTGVILNDVKKAVDELIKHVGKDIIMGMPIGLGQPAILLNEIYRRVKEDPTMSLSVLSALPLEKPKGNSDIERRLLGPISERLFDGVNELDYAVDMREGKLPKNVHIYEFYGKAGTHVNNQHFQMNHLPSNYTHCFRDGVSCYGFNVFAQLISVKKINGKTMYSMGCTTDICFEALEKVKELKAKGEKVAAVVEANANLPFMYGDAVIDKSEYDFILQGEEFNTRLFGAPKDAVGLSDHMIGL
ncbi:MAG: hypothetical protein FWG49_07270, partial [Leptospirales bacterium]|nr:hypothetical protein [Leptospirales bacterium]